MTAEQLQGSLEVVSTNKLNNEPTFRAVPCTSHEVDDRRRVEQVLLGDNSGFTTIVDRYYGSLFNLALRMTGDTEEAKDVVQVAFVKVYEKLSSFDQRQKFFSWIYRIAVNETLNRLRTRQRFTELETDTICPGPSPEEELEKAQLCCQVRRAILSLSGEYRAVIVLRHYHDMSYQEMGFVLKIPEKTVKSRLYTARQTLAGLLK